MTPIGGTDRAIIDIFSKCFQLSIFTLANTLLADPAPPWHQNFQSCVIVVGILMVIFCIVYAEKASPFGKKIAILLVGAVMTPLTFPLMSTPFVPGRPFLFARPYNPVNICYYSKQ